MENKSAFNLPIGGQADWKFGLITRTIERTSRTRYLIHDLSGGWYTASLSESKLKKVLSGELSLLDLNWK